MSGEWWLSLTLDEFDGVLEHIPALVAGCRAAVEHCGRCHGTGIFYQWDGDTDMPAFKDGRQIRAPCPCCGLARAVLASVPAYARMLK